MFELKLDVKPIKAEIQRLKKTKLVKETADIAEKKMQKHIHAKAPRKTGKFSSSFKRKASKDGLRLETKYGDLFKWLEYTGTQAHVIRARRAKVLHWIDPDSGEHMFRYSVNHPGTQPQPFARKGVRKVGPSSADAMLKKIKRQYSWIT